MTQAVLKNTTTDLRPNDKARFEGREAIARELGDVLADAFRLNVNVQGFHWNVEGPAFYALHSLTEQQYKKITASIDVIAERIRALGLPAPQSLTEFMQRSALHDLPTDATVAARVERLIADYETASTRLRSAVSLAEEKGDITTADLLTEQTGRYEDFAWKLRATIAS